MSARLALFFAAAAASLPAIGCNASASGPTAVSITNLVMKVEPDRTVSSGSFELHLARPASASGPSGIRLHELAIRFSDDEPLQDIDVAVLRSELPGDLEPGAEIVSKIDFDLGAKLDADATFFQSCVRTEGFTLVGTYFDEAEQAFFTIRSSPSWVSPTVLTGTLWASTFGAIGPQVANGAAAFADGSSVVVGTTAEATGLDGTTPDLAAPMSSFMIKLDAAGNTVWSRKTELAPISLLGDPQPAPRGPSLVASSPEGGIVIAGTLDGTLDLGGGHVLTSAGDTDVLLARLDATGKASEARLFGDGLAQTVLAMDVDAAANVVLVGTLAGAIDFGSGALAPLISPTFTSYYVARLPQAGPPIYAKVPMAIQYPRYISAAVGAEGSVVLGGAFTGEASIGVDPLYKMPSEAGFLVVLAPDGSIAWSTVLEDVPVIEVAFDQGDIVAVLRVRETSLVGGKELSGGLDGPTMLVRLDPAGALRYAIPLSDTSDLEPTSFTVDSAGHSLLSGTLSRKLAIPGSAIDGAGRPSAFFAEIDRSGAHVRSMLTGCASSPIDLAVSHTGSRDVLLVSTFSGAVDFGHGPTPTLGLTDVIVAKLPAQ